MSGFVALVNLDGAPPDRCLLDRMTSLLSFRGPDSQQVRTVGQAGFGFAWLNVGKLVDHRPPLTFDGRCWIVADARIDARNDLMAALSGESPNAGLAAATDPELIVRAYEKWGDDCASRLLGDFAFAIWDQGRRRLFCARDQFGVRPLYYAQVGSTIMVSNTLDCLRVHRGVSNALNNFAVADFLMFGENREPQTTVFRDINRVPPAHHLTSSSDSAALRKYWTMPVEFPVQFARASDYVDRFNELLCSAVADRLRSDRATVLMSGGIDSTALAAVAADLVRRAGGCTVDAVTSTYERLIPDPERRFAGMVAAHLEIPIRYDVRDHEVSIGDWDRVAVQTPEPVANPAAFVAAVRFLQTTARGARVFFYGEGPDNALRYEWRPFLSYLARSRKLGRLLQALADDALMHPRVPLWSSIRQFTVRRRRHQQWQETFPAWLDAAFSDRCNCRDRWAEQHRQPVPVHPVRPLGHAGLDPTRWQALFEDCDITAAYGQVEYRYPFLDLRLLQYLLALPAMPWCRNKLIIRRAMKPWLPRAVLTRKKTVVPTSADWQRVRSGGLPRVPSSPELRAFIDLSKVPSSITTEQEMRAVLRPLGLAYWLLRYSAVDSKERHGFESAVLV
jgi:asparagine synthase (glutamine-hydrolysing)